MQIGNGSSHGTVGEDDVTVQDSVAGPGVPDANSVDSGATWSASVICWSLFLFLFAGLLEIGGGWLIFVGVRERSTRRPYHSALYIVFGAIVLVAYGFVPTLQPSASFGRIFAVYGGFFIVLSYAWGVIVDKMRLDIGDYIGAAISLLGVLIAWFWPR